MSGSSIGAVVGGTIGFFIGGPAGARWGLQIGALAGGLLMPPVIEGPSIGDAQQQTSQAGVVRPVVFGHPAPFSGNVIDGERKARKITKKVKQGKGGPSTKEEHFILSYAVRVCEGCAEGINYLRIWRNGVVVYDARTTFPAGWEGYSKEVQAAQSKFLKYARLYGGKEDQLPDPTLEGIHGVGNTPYYRGTAYVMLTDEDVTDTGGVAAQWMFEVTRGGVVSVVAGPTLMGHWPLDDGISSNPGEVHTGTARDLSTYNWDGAYVNAVDGTAAIDSHTAGAMEVGVGGGAFIYDDTHLDFSAATAGVWSVALSFTVDDTTLGGAGEKAVAGYWGSVAFGYARFAFMIRSVDGSLGTTRIKAGYTRPGLVLNYVEGPLGATSGRFMLVSRGTGAALELWINGHLVASDPTAGGKTAGGGTDGIRVFAASTFYDATACLGRASNLKYFLGAASEEYIKEDAAYYGHYGGGIQLPDDSDSYYDPETGETVSGGDRTTVETTDITVKTIVDEVCLRCGIPAGKLSVDILDDSEYVIPGFLIAEDHPGSAVLSPLMKAFLFDLPEYDAQIHAIPRGAAAVANITLADLVENERKDFYLYPQSMEYPYKVSIVTQDPNADYAPIPQDSFRYSPDITVTSEVVIPLAIPFTGDKSKQLADKLHKVLWSQAEVGVELLLAEKFSKLVKSDCINFEGRRYLIQETSYVNFQMRIKAVYDRVSNYSSSATAAPIPPPTPPTTNVRGPTIMVPMNSPPLRDQDNVPGIYIGAQGVYTGYAGGQIWMSTDDGVSYEMVLEITQYATMGYLISDPVGVGGEPLVVRLYYTPDELETITEDQRALGGNLAAIVEDDYTTELINFTTAAQNMDGNWELTGVNRGIKGTGQIDHTSGARFVMMNYVYFLPLPAQLTGKTIYFRPVSNGTSFDDSPIIPFVYTPSAAVLYPGPHQRIDGNGNYRVDGNSNYRSTP